ncbi:MAG TPA: hypothetical protein DDW50_22665 [Firmicutes bacterium]|jgi:hypothetical protein|nr:hypothetical protein [Bacillota bacterium]
MFHKNTMVACGWLLFLFLIPTVQGDGPKTYEILKANYQKGNVQIYYPQVIRMKDVHKQEIINRIIQNDVFGDEVQYYEKLGNGSDYELDYKIQLEGPNLLSIEYLGYRYEKGTPHPTQIFYTTNINLHQGTRLQLKDVVTIDKAFIEKLKKSRYRPWNSNLDWQSDAYRYALMNLNDEQLIEELNHADDLQSGYNTFSYFTQDSLGISLGLPHALGDHAEFEIKYREIARNIKKNILGK